MSAQTSAPDPTSKTTLVLRVYFGLATISGALTLWSLLRIPAESEGAVLLGLSKARLLIVSVTLLLILVAVSLLATSWIRKSFFANLQKHLITKIHQRNFWGISILLCALALFGGSYLILLTPEITEPFTLAYFERLQPLLVWFTLLAAQTLVALPLLRYQLDLSYLKPRNRIVFTIAIIFGGLLVACLLIALTGLGLTASDAGAGWNYLGAPVMELQALLAWVVALVYIGLALSGERHPDFLTGLRQSRWLRTDLMISILLWLAALLVWNSIPLADNWFAAPPRPPNQAMYPNSDAILYDNTGQSLLVGVGFKTQNAPFAIRPLYALFLAVLHAVGGVDYEPIIWMQVATLALIPVLLYWISRHLHNRISGLIAASLLILRESNAIILGDTITTSHAKLLMADLPTTLGVMIFVLLMIRWLQNPAQRQTLTLIAGGVCGAFMLIRPEFGVLLPFVGAAALLALLRQPKVWSMGMILVVAGTVLFLAPWIWRNYQITGTIFLDSPHYRADLFAKRYQEVEPETDEASPAAPPATTAKPTEPPAATATPGLPQPTPTRKIDMLPGESIGEFTERMAAEASQYAQNNPGQVLYFITNHFFNSQVQSVLYLPATFRLADSAVGFLGHRDISKFVEQCCSAKGYVRRLPFWFKWDGQFPKQSVVPVLLNLLLISVGLASVWQRHKFIGLLPLAASTGYYLINAVVRNSGGRYILPVDWFGMLYFAIGLSQLTLWGVAYFRGSELAQKITGEMPTHPEGGNVPIWRKANLWVALVILLLGCILPLSEKIVPQRYTAAQLTSRQNTLMQSADLEAFIQSGGRVLIGRALYPRFHKAQQGESGDTVTVFMPAEDAKVSFFMVGPFNGGVIIPQANAPVDFPNGADVVVIGCPIEPNIEALIVAIYAENGELIEVLHREPFPEKLSCPLEP